MSETAGGGEHEGGAALAFASLAYCAALLVCWLTSASLLQYLLGEEHPRLVLVGAQVLGILLPALLLTRCFARSGFPPTTSRRPPPSRGALALALPGLAISGYLVALALNLAWLELLRSAGWEWLVQLESELTERYRELLIAESAAALIGVLLMVSLVPAVCEEMAFRRGLQGLLASRGSAATAIVVTAAVFALFHLEPFGLPTRFFLGLSLGIAYHRTGSLWTAGLLHAAHNLAAVGGLHLAERTREVGSAPSLSELEGVPLGPVAIVGALGLAGWIVSVQLLRPPGDGRIEAAEA